MAKIAFFKRYNSLMLCVVAAIVSVSGNALSAENNAVVFEAQIELESIYSKVSTDVYRRQQEFQAEVAAGYAINNTVSLFGQVEWNRQKETVSGEVETSIGMERKQHWMQYQWHPKDASTHALRIGRNKFKEKREWWWKSELDAITYDVTYPGARFRLGFGKELAPETTFDTKIYPEEQDIYRLFGEHKLHLSNDSSLEVFGLLHKDNSTQYRPGDRMHSSTEDDSDADLLWLGFRYSTAQLFNANNFSLRMDVAFVKGDEVRYQFSDESAYLTVSEKAKYNVEAWAYDVELQWRVTTGSPVSLMLGLAQGSGTKNSHLTRTDSNFRQTGLHENDENYPYYGELLDPDLSNLIIATIGFKWALPGESQFYLIYHHYNQHYLSNELSSDAIKQDPNGISKEIGQSLEVIFLLEPMTQITMEMVVAAFRLGDAYNNKHEAIATYAAVTFGYEF